MVQMMVSNNTINSSILQIERDLFALGETDVQQGSNLYNNNNDNILHMPSKNDSTISGHMSGGGEPSLHSFFQHMTFHLWLSVPLILLFISPDPKCVDKWLQKLFRNSKGNSRKTPSSSCGGGDKNKNSKQQQQQQHVLNSNTSEDWRRTKVRIPLVITAILLFSSIWGLCWAILHLDTTVVR
jgi:hypothetical protein